MSIITGTVTLASGETRQATYNDLKQHSYSPLYMWDQVPTVRVIAANGSMRTATAKQAATFVADSWVTDIEAAHTEAMAYEVAQAAVAYGAALTDDTTWKAATAGTATYLGAVVPARYSTSADALWLYRPVYDTGIVGWARVFVSAATFVSASWVTDVDMAHSEALTADAAHNAAADAAWAARNIDPFDGFDYSPAPTTEPDLTGWRSDHFVSGTVKAFPLESDQRYPARLYSDGRLTVAIGWQTYGTDAPRYESLAATTLATRIAILASWVEETDPANTDWSTVPVPADQIDDAHSEAHWDDVNCHFEAITDQPLTGSIRQAMRHGWASFIQESSGQIAPTSWSDSDLYWEALSETRYQTKWAAEYEARRMAGLVHDAEQAHAEALAADTEWDLPSWTIGSSSIPDIHYIPFESGVVRMYPLGFAERARRYCDGRIAAELLSADCGYATRYVFIAPVTVMSFLPDATDDMATLPHPPFNRPWTDAEWSDAEPLELNQH